MKKECIIPAEDQILYDDLHFSQAVKVGNMIWISGQVGVNASLEPLEGITAQTRQAFQNLQRVLTKAGATMDDVVEITTFHLDMREVAAFGLVKDEFMLSNYPAWAAVGVTQLFLPELRVEIRAVAIIGAGQA